MRSGTLMVENPRYSIDQIHWAVGDAQGRWASWENCCIVYAMFGPSGNPATVSYHDAAGEIAFIRAQLYWVHAFINGSYRHRDWWHLVYAFGIRLSRQERKCQKNGKHVSRCGGHEFWLLRSTIKTLVPSARQRPHNNKRITRKILSVPV